MNRRHLLILIALLTVGTVTAQDQKKIIVEEEYELEKMKAIFHLLYKDFYAIFNNDSSASVNKEPLPWMKKPTRVPSTNDLFWHLDSMQLKPEDSSGDSPNICITGSYLSGMGSEGMIDKSSFLEMTDCGTGDERKTHLISKPIASLGNLRIELISHWYDKELKPIGFSSFTPTYYEKLIRDENGYFHLKNTLHLSLDTLYSAVVGGSMEIRWLGPPVYSHITISAADTNRTDALRLQNIPFRVEVFKPNQFILSSAACYSDSIKKWQYSCFQKGVRMSSSYASSQGGERDELLYMYHHPNITFEEWLEHVVSQPEATGNELWAKLYKTNIDADSIYLYIPVSNEAARVLASVRLVYGQPNATEGYLNETLFYELRGEEENLDIIGEGVKDDEMPVFKAPIPEKDTWNDKQKYNYACGILCGNWVQRLLRSENISIRYGYAVSKFTASHYLPDFEAGRAWRTAHGEKKFLFADFKDNVDSLLIKDNRQAFFFVAGILFPGLFERPEQERDLNLIVRALFDHLETTPSFFNDEAEAIWKKYYNEKKRK